MQIMVGESAASLAVLAGTWAPEHPLERMKKGETNSPWAGALFVTNQIECSGEGLGRAFAAGLRRGSSKPESLDT